MSQDGDRGETEGTPTPALQSRSDWLRPGGISAIAGVAAVLVAVVGIVIAIPRDTSDVPPAASAESAVVLFVYGSSMPGQSRYEEIEPYVTETRRDTTQGVLYDSGLGYPLAKFGPGGTIPGWTLVLDPDTAKDALRIQTKLEAGLFQPTTIQTDSGDTATAYEWIDPTDGFPRIDRWDGSTAHFGQAVEESALDVGDCFGDTGTRGVVLTVWCEAPHAYEVFHRSSDADAADCTGAFEAFIGVPLEDSQLDFTIRTVDDAAAVCAAFAPGKLTTGTLAQTGR